MANTDRLTMVLLSGGIDSACLIPFLSAEYKPLSAFFVDYGQSAAEREISSARRIASHFQVPLTTVAIEGSRSKSNGVIAGRNAMLITLGLMEFSATSGFIAIGIHAGTNYMDCAPQFVNDIQLVVDGYYGGAVRVVAPFLHWSKQQVWAYAQNRIPIAATYSCELGLDQPCGKCLSCMDLESLYARP